MVEVESTTSSPEKTAGRPWVKPLLLGVALIAMLVAAKVFGLGARLDDLRTWILELGAWGPVVFIALYAVAVVAADLIPPPGAAAAVDVHDRALKNLK